MLFDRLCEWGPPPSPETRYMRGFRIRTSVACGVSACAVAGVELLTAVHPFLVLLVLAAVLWATVSLWRYWSLKDRIDRDYAAALERLGSVDETREATK